MSIYRISDAARRTALPTSTLRYYERIGLLPAEHVTARFEIEVERTLTRLP